MAQGELAVLVLGSGLAVASLLVSVSGTLELMLILGPVFCCRTWWLHQAIMIVLWLPILGVSAWLLHGGWHTAIPFVIMGCVLIAAHIVMLFCYWLRYVLRRQAALELPTQQLLTEAHRMMMGPAAAAGGGAADSTGQQHVTSSAANHTRKGDNTGQAGGQFQLQVGRTDGVAGYTLFIPGAAEEAVLQEVAARHFQQQQQHSLRSPGKQPPSSNGASSSSAARVPRSESSSGTVGASFRSFPSRGRNGSPEGNKAAEGGAAGPGGVPGRAVVQVLVPDVMQRWGSSKATSARYRNPDGGFTPPVSGRFQNAVSFRTLTQDGAGGAGDRPGGGGGGGGDVSGLPGSQGQQLHPIKQELSSMMVSPGSHIDRPARDNHLGQHMVEENNPLLLKQSETSVQGHVQVTPGGSKEQQLGGSSPPPPPPPALVHPPHIHRLTRPSPTAGLAGSSPSPGSPGSGRSRLVLEPPFAQQHAADNSSSAAAAAGRSGAQQAMQGAELPHQASNHQHTVSINPLASVTRESPRHFSIHTADPAVGNSAWERDQAQPQSPGPGLGTASNGGAADRRTLSGKPPVWAGVRGKGHTRTQSQPASSLTASLLDEQDSSAEVTVQHVHVKP